MVSSDSPTGDSYTLCRQRGSGHVSAEVSVRRVLLTMVLSPYHSIWSEFHFMSIFGSLVAALKTLERMVLMDCFEISR